MIESPPEATLEFAVLYELALAVGRTLDPEACARTFVERVMDRVPAAFAAVWLLPGADEGETSATLYHALPNARAACRTLAADHPQFGVSGGRPLRLTSDHPDFAGLVAETDAAAGVIVLFPLGRTGVLKLYSPEPARLSVRLVAQLAPVVEKFAVAFEGALAHGRLERTARDLRAILEAVPDPVFKLDARGRFVWWNHAARRTIGCAEAAVAGQDAAALVAPETRGAANDALSQALVFGSAEVDCTLLTADGPRAHHIRGLRVEERDGGHSIVAAARDITEREATLNALRANEARLALALEGARDGLWDWNLDTDEVYFSAGWLEMLGYAPGELPPRLTSWTDSCHPEDVGRVISHARDVAEGRETAFETEFRLRHRSGRWVNVLSRGTLVRSADGAPVRPRRMIGTHVDVTSRRAYEDRIEHSLSLLQATLESTGDAILVTDTGGRVLACNAKLGEIWGMPAVFEGSDAEEVMLEISARTIGGEEFRARVSRLAASPEAEDFALLHLPPDRHVECHSRPHRTLGRVTGRVWRFAEVTAREEAAARLREERDLFLAGAVVVFKWEHAPTWAVLYVSGNVESVLGHRGEDFTSGARLYLDLVHPDDRERVRQEVLTAAAGRAPTFEHTPYRIRRGDGRYIWVTGFTMVLRGADGTPRQYFGYIIDVTERVVAQQALGRERGFLRLLLDAIPDLIFFKDRNGVYRGCNRAFERYVGRPEEAVVGCTDLDFFDPETAAAYRFHDRRMLDIGGPRRNEEWITYPDGRRAVIETLKTPYLGADGEVDGLIGISRDITERHQAEEARNLLEAELRQSQKMEAIGQLTGGIAHDFNNMLSVILGYAAIGIEESTLEESGAVRLYFDEIRRSGERARDLVAKMLAFSRKRLVAARVPVDPLKGVPEVMRMLRPTLPASLTVRQVLDARARPFLGDAVELHQILTNLVINARDATNEHGIIEVRVAPEPNAIGHCATCSAAIFGPYTRIEVVDDGEGIAPEHIARIFDPFFTTKEVGKGTGMGLSVVHGIVHDSGGHIQVASTPGRGSVFTVLLPAIVPIATAEPPSGAYPAMPIGQPRRRIMLVDDEPAITQLVSRMLRNHGYEVDTFSDGQAALEAFQADPARFDAILTDQTMPELTGRELLTQVLALRPELPTILTSGFSDAIGGESAEAMGIRCFLQKPATLKEILAAVHGLFEPR
jgi:PAS domain S-box-containing protein